MTLFQQTTSRAAATAFCALAMAGCLALPSARADESNKRTILTVSQTVQIGNAVLQPGKYVIKLLDSQTQRHVVQIFNSTQTHIIATEVAIPTERLVPRGHTTFAYYETPAGTVRALRTWYYPGDDVGQRFVEPKHHEMLAAGIEVVENPLAFNEEAPAAATTATQAENEPPASAPSTSDQQSADRQVTETAEPAPAPAEVAQNTAPAADDTAAQSSPTPATTAPATQLPQTGTSYPAIGLLGAMLLGLAGLSRVWRCA